ncbi:hypothetical protein Syun_016455 [Stephania yunnanensis]|uniref:Uncharacterized protein n=1 Tax=Stephania yunnanensis TaxID=152371 RepID=A0AAP0P273_9MAGN
MIWFDLHYIGKYISIDIYIERYEKYKSKQRVRNRKSFWGGLFFLATTILFSASLAELSSPPFYIFYFSLFFVFFDGRLKLLA